MVTATQVPQGLTQSPRDSWVPGHPPGEHNEVVSQLGQQLD